MLSRLITLLASIALTFIIYPSAFLYPKDTLPDRNDTRLITYIINQVQKNIVSSDPLHFGTYFAPEPKTLTYSDLFLSSAFTSLPVRFFTDHPILIFNLVFILNTSLTIFTSYHFYKLFLTSHSSSIIATLLFNLSGFHLHYYAHLQVFSLWLFFSSLINLYKYTKTNQSVFLHLCLVFATLQLGESIFTTYLLFFASVILFLPNLKKIIPGLIKPQFFTYPAIWIYLLFPYSQTHDLYPEAARSIRDAAHFALGVDQIFTLYHSYLAIVLLVIALFFQKNIPKYWLYLLLFSMTMSLGPVLKIFGETLKFGNIFIPLPYSLFYYLFPGFAGFRTPSRFIVLFLLATCLIIGHYLYSLFKNLKTKTKIFLITLLFSLLALEANLPLTSYSVNITMHPVYQEVAKLPNDAVILELPIKLWTDPDHEIESIRSIYSLYHNHRRLGGFSGFATLEWIDLVHSIQKNGLTPTNLEKIKSRGVSHLIENNKLIHPYGINGL